MLDKRRLRNLFTGWTANWDQTSLIKIQTLQVNPGFIQAAGSCDFGGYL